MNRRSDRLFGFTLIELLVAVGILAILAAIGVARMIDAQTRGQVSRALADFRTAATALESYAVDEQVYPAYGHPDDAAPLAGEAVVFLPISLTTPVVYLSSLPADPFPGKRTAVTRKPGRPYFYMNDYRVIYLGKSQAAGHVQTHYYSMTGERRPVKWTVWSYGPDLDDDHGVDMYDPTNGTTSNGDLAHYGP